MRVGNHETASLDPANDDSRLRRHNGVESVVVDRAACSIGTTYSDPVRLILDRIGQRGEGVLTADEDIHLRHRRSPPGRTSAPSKPRAGCRTALLSSPAVAQRVAQV